MEPGEFQVHASGLSEQYMIIIISVLTVCLFVYLLYTAKKKGIATVDGKFRPIASFWRSYKENRSTIHAVINKSLVGRYNNSYFGILWNVISPLLLVFLIYFIFINVKGVYPDRHYWTYICSGIFIVTMCRQSLSGMSFRGNSPIIKKLPTPGWVIAFGDTVSNFITCLIPYTILIVFMAIRGISFNLATVLYTPLLLIILFVFCFGLTMLFSTITVLWGDVRQVMVTLSRALIWISPVFFYLCDCVPDLYTATMWNPFTYTVEPFHQAISYGIPPDMMLVSMSILLALFFLVLGILAYVKKMNRVRELI